MSLLPVVVSGGGGGLLMCWDVGCMRSWGMLCKGPLYGFIFIPIFGRGSLARNSKSICRDSVSRG